jgi:hypothetical protein
MRRSRTRQPHLRALVPWDGYTSANPDKDPAQAQRGSGRLVPQRLHLHSALKILRQENRSKFVRRIIHNSSEKKRFYREKKEKNAYGRQPFMLCVICARALEKTRYKSRHNYM